MVAADTALWCTCRVSLQPTSALVAVPDPRLKILASMAKSVAVVPKQLRFVDIAGLIRGASEGNGLGMYTVGYLSFGPMAQCVVHALKGLACRARVTTASSPALHARGCASPSRARERHRKHKIFYQWV